MRATELQAFDQYRYGPRSVLVPGDRFRVSDGPVYITDAGRTVPMFERGIFVFHRFCVRGAAKWIEANRQDGAMVVLWVGKSCRSPIEANLRRRPYRITGKVTNP
jgi:hypothetical protein